LIDKNNVVCSLEKIWFNRTAGPNKRLQLSAKNLTGDSQWFKTGLMLGHKANYDPKNCYLGGIIATAGAYAANFFCEGVPTKKWRWP
jgi:hypothetical protein